MHKVCLFVALLTLSACSSGVGQPGSIAWQLTANDVERQYFGNGELTTARLQCAQGGYEGAGYDACVRNSMKY